MKTTGNKALWALGIMLVLLVATGAGDFDPTIVVDAWIVVSPDVTSLNITANATDGGQINASNGHLNYTIYNVTGHGVTASNIAMLWNGSLWNATNVDISSLPAGDYYVCVNATNASFGNWSYNNTNWFAVGSLVVMYAPNYTNSSNITIQVDALHDSGYNEDLNSSTINGDMNYTLYYRNGTLAQLQQLISPISDHWEFYVTVSGDYYAVLNATHYNLRGSNITAVFAVGELDVVPQLNTSNPLNVSLMVDVSHGGEVLNDTNINGDANYTLYYTNDSVAGSGSLIYSDGYWRAYVDHTGDFYATINATHYNLEGSNSTVNFAVGALDVVPELNTSNPLNVSLRVDVSHDGEVLNDTNINGDANYTLYYTNDSVAGSGSLIYSNGYWRTYVDVPEDYYYVINVTHYNLKSSNTTGVFAVGNVLVKFIRDYAQNSSEITFFVNASHVDRIVDNMTGNVSYFVAEAPNLNGTLSWDGALWGTTMNFSSLIPDNYNLRINVTHYNLLNVTDIPFTVQNLSGFVTDAYNSMPVENAQVVFMNATNCIVNTDGNGFYSMEIANFTLLVPWMNVSHNAYQMNVTNEYESMTLTGNTHIYGIIKNIETKISIESVLIEVINYTSDELLYVSNTNFSGYYDLWIRGDFNYTINASHGSYVGTTSVMQGANSSLSAIELNFSLYARYRGSVTVNTRDAANGRPIPDAFVRIIGMGGSQGVTDADGQVTLFVTGDANSEYRINITHPDYGGVGDTNPFSVLEGQDVSKPYQLTGRSVVEGYVKDRDNQEPVGGVFVQLLEHGTSNRFGYDNAYFYNTSTHAGGYYRMLIPTSLLNSSNLYDVQFIASRYEAKTMDKNHAGYHGSQQIDTYLTGLLQVDGTVVDDYNENPIQGAYVEISEIGDDFTYNALTNASGGFMIRIRNNALGYTVKVAKDGYGQNTSSASGSTTLYVRLKGSAAVQGRIVDKYKDNNVTTIPIPSAEVKLVVNGSVLYNTTSDGNGDFSMDICDGVSYHLEINKSGYDSVGTPQYNTAHDFGNIELTGKAVISGTVMDVETKKIGYRALSGVNVTISERTHMYNYMVQTNDNGEYSVNIPSDTQYAVAYNVAGYDSKTVCGGNCTAVEGDNPMAVELVGSTTIDGTIFDEYEPSRVLGDAVVLFKDSSSGSDLYQLSTDVDGTFSVNLGVTANYIMDVNRSGYETRIFYGPGGIGYFPEIDIIFSGGLTGTISVNAKITDYLSGDPIPAATVKIFDVGQNLSSVPRYMGFTGIDGEVLIRVDGNSIYKYYVHSHGYPKLVLDNGGNGYTASHSFNESLRASFEVEVKDAQNNQPIKNARLSAFHFFNQTNFGPYLFNKTIVSIAANCSGQTVAGINISLSKTSCEDFQKTLGLCFFSANTTSSSEVVSFEKVPTGTYDLTIDGSAVGCALVTDTLDVNPGMAGWTSVFDYSGQVDENRLVVHVQNDSQAIEGANVTVWNGAVGSTIAVNYSGELLTGLTCSSGDVVYHRVFAGTYTMSVEDNGYDFYESAITINYGDNYRNITLGDTIAPAYSDVGDNSSGDVFQGDMVKMYGYWTDAMEIDHVWLETNKFGFWLVEENLSLSATSSWTNFTFDTSWLGGIQLSWRIRARDTYGNENTTTEHTFNINVDSYAPAYLNVGDNSSGNVVAGEDVKIYAYWTDNRELDYAWLQTNKTGSWTDESIVPLSGNESWSNFTFDTTGLDNRTVGWRISAYDTTGLNNVTAVMTFDVSSYASLTVRVHDPNNNSVSGVTVEVRNSTGSIVKDSGGQDLVGVTDSNGLVAFSGVLPCTGCSVNISKSADVRLTNDGSYSYLPHITTDSDNVHVVWQDQMHGGYDIYYKNYTSASQWSEYRRLTNNVSTSWGPDIVVDSISNLHVVWGDFRDGNYEVYYKNRTSAAGWSGDVRLTNAINGSWYPDIAVDSNDNLYVVWEDDRDGNREVYYKNYTSAAGWSSDVRLTNNVSGSLGPQIAIDSNDSLHLVWYDSRDGDSEIYYKNHTSINGWSDDIRLTNNVSDSSVPRIAIDTSDNLHVVWEDQMDGTDEIYYKNHTSASGWSSDVRLTAGAVVSRFPDIAIDSSDNLHIVWHDFRDGNYEIYYQNHTSSGGWSGDVRLTNATDDSEYPRIAIDSSNHLHIVWKDERDGNYEIYYRNYEGYNYIVNSTGFDISWGENKFIEIDPEFPDEPDFGASGEGGGFPGSLFTVFIEDSFGGYVGDGVVVELSQAGYFAQGASAGGMVVFDADGLLEGLEYELYVDGSWQGYGVRRMVVDGPFAGGELTVALNTTIMRANITDNTGRAVGGADVMVYESDDVTIARDATGERLEGVTDSGGFMTFYRMLPSLDYNLSTVKDGVFNSTSFNISAGENKTVDLDPTPYLNVSSGVQNITITVQNSTGDPLEYVAVTLYDYRSVEYATNRTNASGVAAFYDIADGVYTTEINGNEVGHGASTVILKFGRLTFVRQKTQGDGRVSAVVDGQVNYYIRIDAAGYEVYDSLDDGVIFSGTYSDAAADLNPEQADIKNSFAVQVNGTATISGIISDKYFNTTSSPKKWLDGATIKLLEDNVVRYETVAVGSGGGYGNGSYMMRISPFIQDSDLNETLVNASYDIETSMVGYLTDKSDPNKYADAENRIYNVEMTGEGSVDGSIYDINTSQLITSVENGGDDVNDGNITVQIYDEFHTLMYTSSTGSGSFFLTINPYYSPYYLDLDTNNYELLPQTDSYNGSQSGLELYLYPLTCGYVNFSVKLGNESPVSGASIVYYYSGGEPHNLVTDVNGLARDFIFNNTYNLIVNGTYPDYCVSVTTFTVDEGREKQLDLTLDSTVVNITLLNQNGQSMDGVNVTLEGHSQEHKTTVNGSVLFYKVLLGTYYVNVSVPDYLNVSDSMINVNSLCQMNTKILIVNETQYNINLTNGSAGIANVTVILGNGTFGNSTLEGRNGTTDTEGGILFTEIYPGDYLVRFNETELYSAGYFSPEGGVYANVIAGRDGQTGNNKTIVLNSTGGYGVFRVNTGLSGVNVSLWYNNTDYIECKVTDPDGVAFLKVNVSIYNSSLYVRAEKENYNDGINGSFNASAGNITLVDITLYANCPEGAITSTCWCGGVLYGSGYCCSGSHQASACGGGYNPGGGGSSTSGSSSGTVVITDDDDVIEDIYGLSVYAEPYYVLTISNGTGCVDMPIRVSNTGNTVLRNLSIELSGVHMGIEPRFDSLMDVLYAGEMNPVMITMCSADGIDVGDYGYNVSVFNGDVRGEVSVTLRVVRGTDAVDDVAGRLRARLDRLGSILFDINASVLDTQLKEYYDIASLSLKEAEDYLDSGDYDSASSSLDEAERYIQLLLEGIEGAGDEVPDAINWYVLSAVALALAFGSVLFYWFFLRKRIGYSKEPVLPWNLPFGVPIRLPAALSSVKVPKVLLKVLGKHDVYYSHSLSRRRYLTDVVEKVLELKCPKCGGKIYQNRCVWCGFKINSFSRAGNDSSSSQVEEDGGSSDHFSKGKVYYTHRSQKTGGAGDRFVADAFENVVEEVCPKCGGKVYKGKCVYCG